VTARKHWHTVCQLDQLAQGAFVEFSIGDRDGFVFLHDSVPKAYLNRCPHLGIGLNWMPGRFMDLDNCFLQCSTHGALFEPGSGKCIAGPCQGDQLTALAVQDLAGEIQVRLTE
tara:strand:+ start:1237 stop:1578 length:342 start_codon:yes stop_codon:yes gene_type:complete